MSLHQQLIAQVDAYDCVDPHCTPRASNDRCTRHALAAALRAAVKLHAPTQVTTYGAGLPIQVWVCGHCANLCHSRSGLGCDEPRDGHYPCADIQAIACELGIEATNHG